MRKATQMLFHLLANQHPKHNSEITLKVLRSSAQSAILSKELILELGRGVWEGSLAYLGRLTTERSTS